MKRKITHVLLTLFALQAPIIGYAHEKGNHASADNQKPNCETMENMDHSKMDMNDPAMQAIMQKCMKHDMEGNNMDHSKMDMNDPDMQAMMQKCMKHGMEGNHMHNETEVEKSASETEKSSMQHKHKQ